MPETDPAPDPEKAPIRRIYRSQQQRVIAGVCGGVAEYFNVDVVVVRLLWVLFTLIGGSGIVAYIICWIMIPDGQPGQRIPPASSGTGAILLGIFLILIGVAMLFTWSGFCSFALPFCWSPIAVPGIILVLVLGLLLGWLLSRPKRNSIPRPDGESPSEPTAGTAPTRLYRSRNFRVISGICGGLGQHLKIDPTIIRILWVLFAITSLGVAVLLYIILIFVIPEEP